MSAPVPESAGFSSPIDQLSSLLALSQEIRTACNAGKQLSKPDILSKLDTILPPSPPHSHLPLPYAYSTPHKYPNELAASADSGVALTGSFSSLYESDESVLSPFAQPSARRANRSHSIRPATAKNLRNERSRRSFSPQQDMSQFLQTVSTEFSTSLRALLAGMEREERRQDELAGSGSDVTLPELEQMAQASEEVSQLIENNSRLLSSCQQLKAKVKEERTEGNKVRKENTSLQLEREGLLCKMSETEREIIDKLSEHGALLESYSALEERLKEWKRRQREAQARIVAMETEANKLTSLLSRVQRDLAESSQREDECQRENSHLQDELVLKGREIIELKSAAERVQSHARILSGLDRRSAAPDTYTAGLVSTDEILRDTTSLCDQLSSLTDQFRTGQNLSQVRSGLSHALADGNLLLRNIAALRSEHELCKGALSELQLGESPDLLSRIAEMVPLLKLEAEQLAEQEQAAQVNSLILSHISELLTEHTGREVATEALISTLSAVLARESSLSVCSLGSDSAELEGRLQESSELLGSMSAALNGEQAKRRSQARTLKKKILRDTALIRGLRQETENVARREQLVREDVSRLCENVQSGNIDTASLGITSPCVRELSAVVRETNNGKIQALETSLQAAYDRGEETLKMLEIKLSDNEELNEQVRRLTLERPKLDAVNAQLQRCLLELETQLITEREDSDTRENLLTTKLRIIQQHIQKYDDVMFSELDKLSTQVKEDITERDLQQRREDSSLEAVRSLKEELTAKQEELQFLQKEVTVYKVQLFNQGNSHREEIEKLKQSNQYSKPTPEKKVQFYDDLPAPTPLTVPPMTSLKGNELRSALGVALTQEQLYAKAHLSLQTERDDLARENSFLRDRMDSLHQRTADPLGSIAKRSLPHVPCSAQKNSYEEARLASENETLASQVSELNTRASKLAHFRNLYFDSKTKYRSLLWQKSYLKSQLSVYSTSLLVSGLTLGEQGVARRGCSKFRVFVWTVIFIRRLSHTDWRQQNIIYLPYTAAKPCIHF